LADKTYLFWVKARNAVGTSAFSSSISIHSASKPAAPGNPFRMSTTSQNQVVVGWTKNAQNNFGGSQLTGYEVWWNQGPIINTYVKFSTVNSATFSQIISPVTTSSNYKVYIVAKNIVGDSPQSQIAEIWAAIIPNAPVNLGRVPGTNAESSISIQWDKAYNGGSTITGYQVWWNQGGSGPVTEILAVINTDAPTHQVTGLTPGQNYGFAVKAVNVVGVSDLSSLKVIMSATIPDAPSTPVMISQSETQITVSWNPAANDGGSALTQY
jgi:large repetitive protein